MEQIEKLDVGLSQGFFFWKCSKSVETSHWKGVDVVHQVSWLENPVAST